MKLIIFTLILGVIVAVSLGQNPQCGIFSSKTSFPWTVKIRESVSNDVVCMGTIISSRHIVTAAHCLWPKPYYKALKVISRLYVQIGEEKTKYDLMDVRFNPEWKFNSGIFDADIAILTLFKTLSFSDSVQPICLLPPTTDGIIATKDGVFTGLDHLADNQEYRSLIKVQKNEDCFNNFPSSYKTASKNTFCAAWTSGNISLFDVPSGAFYFQYNNIGPWYFQGVESQSFVQKNDCEISKHTIFANVANYHEWIQNLVKRDLNTNYQDFELQCNFVRNYEGLYGCEVENLTIASPNYRVASIAGKHTDKNSNSDVEYVWIKNSQVKFLPRFSPIFFPKMKKYLVTSSGLKSINRDDFMGMPMLETVDFSHNDLEEIPEDTLYDLNELVDFFISNNKIKYLPTKLLSEAPLFQRFRAENNTLEQLDAGFFAKNPSLKIVSLDNNRLAKIKVDFRPFKNLKKVDLLNNQCISTSYNDWRKQKTTEIISKEIEASCA